MSYQMSYILNLLKHDTDPTPHWQSVHLVQIKNISCLNIMLSVSRSSNGVDSEERKHVQIYFWTKFATEMYKCYITQSIFFCNDQTTKFQMSIYNEDILLLNHTSNSMWRAMVKSAWAFYIQPYLKILIKNVTIPV